MAVGRAWPDEHGREFVSARELSRPRQPLRILESQPDSRPGPGESLLLVSAASGSLIKTSGLPTKQKRPPTV
jgi:hypothetical protein